MPNIIQLDEDNKIVGEFFYEDTPEFVGVDHRFMIKPHEYLEKGWRLVNGNWLEPLPLFEEDLSTNVPQLLTSFQAHAILSETGLLDEVTALINSPSTPIKIKLAWEHKLDWRRDNPMVSVIAQILNLSSQQVDALFIAGAAITPDVL